jgi:phosphoribosylglycinamide formyltransferase-1
VTQTGASVIVVDNGVDTGPIIARERVPVLPDDTESSLHERIKIVERRLLIQAVLDIANGNLDLKELATA